MKPKSTFPDQLRAAAAATITRNADINIGAKLLKAASVIESLETTGARSDPDHFLTSPMDNQEAVLHREIDRLKAENESLKIKLSRMCGDA